MRTILLAAVLGVALGAGVSAALTRPAFLDAQDFAVAPSPCGAAMTMQATPFVYQEVIWATYLCSDNRVIMRQFAMQAQDEARPPVCPVGFVWTKDGRGCVPPDHPLAK